jgi:IclR family acetate operon transcriptional repressor
MAEPHPVPGVDTDDSDAPPTTQKTIGAVERATNVLRLFVETQQPTLGVTEIAHELGLSKAVVHRVLTSLRNADLVEIEMTSRRYQLGPQALALGLAYLSRQDLRDRSRPYLEELSRLTAETATLSIRRADVRVYLDQVTPPREVKMTVAIGESYPLHAGSSSKAFLAFLPIDEQEVYIRDHSLDRLTDLTITDPQALRDELATIRTRGYARSLGERQPGSASVAAPVFNHLGEAVGVISVCGPSERFKPNMDQAAELLIEKTRELSGKLGYRPLPQ